MTIQAANYVFGVWCIVLLAYRWAFLRIDTDQGAETIWYTVRIYFAGWAIIAMLVISGEILLSPPLLLAMGMLALSTIAHDMERMHKYNKDPFNRRREKEPF